MSLTIRLLGAGDAAVLDTVAPDVFDHGVDPRWATEFLADPRHHLVVALAEEQVVGFASAVHYIHPDKPPALWINEVGVAPAHQGQGIGRQILTIMFDHGRTLGCQEAWVGTEESNIPARRLYAAVGGIEEAFLMISFRLTPEA